MNLGISHHTHRYGIGSTQLSLKTVWECPGRAGLIRIEEANDARKGEHAGYGTAEQEKGLGSLEVIVLLRTECCQDVVVFMDRLAEVPFILGIPPPSIWVTELALHCWRVLISPIL